MRTLTVAIALIACGAAWPGCAANQKVSGGLGKVVVYRNGVAYYERRAKVNGQDLLLTVPSEQIDDFLKSLTIRDAQSGKSLPVSFPSRGSSGSNGLVEMVVRLPPNAPSDVILTYITEAPAWKPSYRVTVNDEKTVELEGWAIVDNTSGETWEEVMIGVGSSSALSFRYDLWSIRDVRRQTLSQQDSFAVAPPTGASPYSEDKTDVTKLADFSDEQINAPAGHPDAPPPAVAQAKPAPPADSADYGDDDDDDDDDSAVEEVRVAKSSSGSATRESSRARRKREARRRAEKQKRKKEALEARRRYQRNERLTDQLAAQLKKSNKSVVIEGYANAGEPSAGDRALDRANTLRNQLIRRGVAPAKLKVRSAGTVEGRPGGVRLVADKTAQKNANGDGSSAPGSEEPVGESHFQSATPVTLARGTSTMVSIVKKETPGTMVYLYDAESNRGNDRFAFRAVRLENPTEYTLEAGPVTVYGEGRFIGEGLTDPIPPKSAALIPFALDRQVIVERKIDRRDQIAGLIKLSRGALSAEMQHVRDTALTLTNRSHVAVVVYVRHTVGDGWELVKAPKAERLGQAHLFPVKLGAGKTATLEIREATPLVRTLDLNSDETLDMVSAYLTSSKEHAELAEKMKPLMALHKKMADHQTAIRTLREQMRDYRARLNELHAQIVTLKAVKSGGDLTRHLKSKMKEISNRVQKATLAVVKHQEGVMLARVKFQDAIAELSIQKRQVAAK